MGYYIDLLFDKSRNIETKENIIEEFCQYGLNKSEIYDMNYYTEEDGFCFNLSVYDKRDKKEGIFIAELRFSWGTNPYVYQKSIKFLYSISKKMNFEIYDGQCGIYFDEYHINDAAIYFQGGSLPILNMLGSTKQKCYSLNLIFDTKTLKYNRELLIKQFGDYGLNFHIFKENTLFLTDKNINLSIGCALVISESEMDTNDWFYVTVDFSEKLSKESVKYILQKLLELSPKMGFKIFNDDIEVTESNINSFVYELAKPVAIPKNEYYLDLMFDPDKIKFNEQSLINLFRENGLKLSIHQGDIYPIYRELNITFGCCLLFIYTKGFQNKGGYLKVVLHNKLSEDSTIFILQKLLDLSQKIGFVIYETNGNTFNLNTFVSGKFPQKSKKRFIN